MRSSKYEEPPAHAPVKRPGKVGTAKRIGYEQGKKVLQKSQLSSLKAHFIVYRKKKTIWEAYASFCFIYFRIRLCATPSIFNLFFQIIALKNRAEELI